MVRCSFWAGILVSALAVGLLGVAMEVLLLRRIYRAPELFQLLATFGVVLVVQDLVIRVFGPQDILGPRAPGLRAPVEILGRRFPSYELVLIAAGPVVLGLLWLLMNKTRFGVLVRAATQDREMVGALGVNQALLFTGTLFLGAFLAGLGGALQIPKAPAVAHMDLDIIAETFVVTVVGGMGSIPGAFLAALVIGQLNAFGILVFPKITLVLVFLLMGVVLVLRPYGLLGRPEAPAGAHVAAIGGRLRTWGAAEKAIAIAALAVLMLLPLFGDAYALKVATEVMIFGLFAFSLHFLIGTGGLVSFGHAAYFGLGAYGAALALRHLGAPMELALPLAPIAAAARGGAVRLLHRAAVGDLPRHADARRGADPLRRRVPVGRGDGRRQRARRNLAVALGRKPPRLLLPHARLRGGGGRGAAARHLRAVRLHAARGARFGAPRRRDRHRRAPPPLARLHPRRRRRRACRRALRLPQGLDRPLGARHPGVDRRADHAAPRRLADRDGPARRRRRAAHAERPDHAADRAVADDARPVDHRHGAAVPGGLVGAFETVRARLAGGRG